MEQFLNIPNPIGFLWLILVGLSMMIAFLVLKFTKLEWDDVLVGWMVSITIINYHHHYNFSLGCP